MWSDVTKEFNKRKSINSVWYWCFLDAYHARNFSASGTAVCHVQRRGPCDAGEAWGANQPPFPRRGPFSPQQYLYVPTWISYLNTHHTCVLLPTYLPDCLVYLLTVLPAKVEHEHPEWIILPECGWRKWVKHRFTLFTAGSLWMIHPKW